MESREPCGLKLVLSRSVIINVIFLKSEFMEKSFTKQFFFAKVAVCVEREDYRGLGHVLPWPRSKVLSLLKS